jgi:hypothetical protein
MPSRCPAGRVTQGQPCYANTASEAPGNIEQSRQLWRNLEWLVDAAGQLRPPTRKSAVQSGGKSFSRGGSTRCVMFVFQISDKLWQLPSPLPNYLAAYMIEVRAGKAYPARYATQGC